MSMVFDSGYCTTCSYKDDAVALGEGFLKGDDSSFSPVLKQLVQRTGITHLAAASGANLALVTKLIPVVPYTGRLLLRLLVVGAYCQWLGWSGSLWRAWLFWLYQWTASAQGRPGSAWRMVMTGFLFSLVGTPHLFREASVQLSFLAWWGLHVSRYMQPGENNLRKINRIASFLFSKKKAFLQGWMVLWFVTPILWGRWHVFQPVGVLTTLATEPFVPWYFALSGGRMMLEQLSLTWWSQVISTWQTQLYILWWQLLSHWDALANQHPHGRLTINSVIILAGMGWGGAAGWERWHQHRRIHHWCGQKWVGG